MSISNSNKRVLLLISYAIKTNLEIIGRLEASSTSPDEKSSEKTAHQSFVSASASCRYLVKVDDQPIYQPAFLNPTRVSAIAHKLLSMVPESCPIP